VANIHYVVISNVITDDIVLTDGTRQPGMLGGAATYAAAGMRVWSDGVGIVSGIGRDFRDLHGAWFDRNGIDMTGLFARDEFTPRSWVIYHADGERDETPQYGYDHFKRMEPMPRDIPAHYRGAQGVYVFRDDRPDFWREMLALRQQSTFTLLWEIAANVTTPDHWTAIADILQKVDLLSINRTEASQLCQTRTPEQALDRLLSTGVKAVALRMGADGALVADQQAVWHIPTMPTQVVDVTGAGNAFSGAFLVGYCASRGDLPTAGIYGAVSAALMIRQYGPPAAIDADLARQYSQSARPAQHSMKESS